MKKLVYVSALGLLLVGLSGCSRSWPSCFCNRSQPSYESADCCETCDPCSGGMYESAGSYYMPGVSDVEWVPQSGPTTIDSLPTPGPDRSST